MGEEFGASATITIEVKRAEHSFCFIMNIFELLKKMRT
jgi:hypothetical protein